MTEKELKKLSRRQLLELLLKQTEYSEFLEKKLKETERKLDDKILIEAEAGSIAEASLRLNGVFEAAQAAANQYLSNIKRIHDNKEKLLLELEKKVEATPNPDEKSETVSDITPQETKPQSETENPKNVKQKAKKQKPKQKPKQKKKRKNKRK